MQTNSLGMILAVLSAFLVVALSILFCFICTRKINKVSVIDAIRQGNTGERFSRSRKIRLSRMRMTKTADFLSLSDLLNGFRKFAVLTITFIIGTLLVIVPLNVINTLKDSETILGLFGLPPYEVNVWTDETYSSYVSGDFDALENELVRIEALFEKEGYPVDLHAEIAKTANMYTNNSNDSFNVNAWKSQNYSANDFKYLEGSAPVLENEIAVSTKMAGYFDITIGDSVSCHMQDKTYTFIVTALYQSMMGMGSNIRLSDTFPMTPDWLSSISIMGKFSDKTTDVEKAVSEMKMAYPELTIGTEIDMYNNNLGGSVKAIDSVKNLIVTVVLGIIFLITSLIVRMLISREISEIALLKSIGFRSNQLRRWQIGRIAIILILSIILGTFLAGSLGGLLINAAFSIMGATQVDLVIVPLQVYLIYPAVLLASTILAAAISIGQINRTKVWEINNQE
jgi:putative ABC transport system permease protein